MDTTRPGAPEPMDADNTEEMGEGDEIEVTREELVTALQDVVRNLSDGLKGEDRDAYLSADDLAQND